jgi:hypothetical protein
MNRPSNFYDVLDRFAYLMHTEPLRRNERVEFINKYPRQFNMQSLTPQEREWAKQGEQE